MKFKKLCPELVDALGELKEKRKALQADESKLVDLSKDLLAEKKAPAKTTTIKLPDGGKKIQKVYSPKGADYEFVYTEFPCLDVSWREEYEELWKQINGKKGWKKHLKKLPRRQQTQLDVNPKG